jgi:DNA-binding protein H-NS
MSTLSDLIAQKEALDAQIDQVRSESLKSVVFQIQTLMRDHGLSMADIMETKRSRTPRAVSSSSPREPAPARYQDLTTGKTWSGLGKPPNWIKGQNREDFLIS